MTVLCHTIEELFDSMPTEPKAANEAIPYIGLGVCQTFDSDGQFTEDLMISFILSQLHNSFRPLLVFTLHRVFNNFTMPVITLRSKRH